MVRIVKSSPELTCVCDHCLAVLSYTRNEIKVISNGSSRYGEVCCYAILCPSCNKYTSIK